jgi:hypothetical protein
LGTHALRSILEHGLLEKKARNERYSLRAFARDLDISPTSLSLFMQGKRGLAPAAAERVRERLSALFPHRDLSGIQAPAAGEVAAEYTPLDLDKVAVISDWYHFAILSLLELDDFVATPARIARRLNLPQSTATAALERLARLDLTAVDRHGRLRATGKSFSTPDQVSHMALRRPHYQCLELAKESLDNDPIEKRNFSAMTMAIDPDRLDEARRRVKRFNRALCAYLEGGKKTEVYRLCVQLFPLSR